MEYNTQVTDEECRLVTVRGWGWSIVETKWLTETEFHNFFPLFFFNTWKDREVQQEKGGKIVQPLIHSPKRPPTARYKGQVQDKSQEPHLISHKVGRQLSIHAVSCCLARHISRDQQRSSWASNQCSVRVADCADYCPPTPAPGCSFGVTITPWN